MPPDITIDPAATTSEPTLAAWDHTADVELCGHMKAAGRWNTIHYSVGLLATVLSAIAGVGALADLFGITVAGILALAAAVVGSVVAFLKPGDRRAAEYEMVGRWKVLHEKIGIAMFANPLDARTYNDIETEYLDLMRKTVGSN